MGQLAVPSCGLCPRWPRSHYYRMRKFLATHGMTVWKQNKNAKPVFHAELVVTAYSKHRRSIVQNRTRMRGQSSMPLVTITTCGSRTVQTRTRMRSQLSTRDIIFTSHGNSDAGMGSFSHRPQPELEPELSLPHYTPILPYPVTNDEAKATQNTMAMLGFCTCYYLR